VAEPDLLAVTASTVVRSELCTVTKDAVEYGERSSSSA
jgi:hypothetical protein